RDPTASLRNNRKRTSTDDIVTTSIMLNGVTISRGTTKNAAVFAALVECPHSACRDPTVTPAADYRGVNARLGKLPNELAESQESVGFFHRISRIPSS
ncbi:MAG: hypothetical protein ACKPKO_47610, partial [Candidatus Fonsibacter sp.]